MRAVVCERYGPPEVLRLVDRDKPVPEADDVLVKIHATTVHVGDTKIRALRPGMGRGLDPLMKGFMRIVVGLRGPRRRVLGMELSGEVEAVGPRATGFEKGDEVFCGTGMRFGAYAEYICLPCDWALVKKPITMSHDEAATVPNGATTALMISRRAAIQPGQKVLVYGASGSVGTFAVQLAKGLFGAHVTGVCSGRNLELVSSLGADDVIDYTSSDFAKNGVKYDVIFDAVGKLSRSKAKRSLSEGGKYWSVLTDSGTSMKLQVADLELLRDQIDAGKLRTVIDRTYRLEEIVEAHRYVDTGRKRGNVVVRVVDEDSSGRESSPGLSLTARNG